MDKTKTAESPVPANISGNYCIMRLDDNGQEFMISDGHSFEEATRIAEEFERRGHKQMYWVKRKDQR